MRKITVADSYFSVPIDKNSQKVPPFSVGRQLMRVCMPLFWHWPSSFKFYENYCKY